MRRNRWPASAGIAGRHRRNTQERKVDSHDQAIVGILKAIRELMHTPEPKKRPIGFTANLDE